jgi:HSP20 family protein
MASSEEDMAMLLPDPFETLSRLQQALDTFQQSDWLESSPSGTGPYPPLNVFRKGDDFVIVTELPGVKKSELDIQVKDNAIRIAGAKSVDYTEKASLHRRERAAGRFDPRHHHPVRIDADPGQADTRRASWPCTCHARSRTNPGQSRSPETHERMAD